MQTRTVILDRGNGMKVYILLEAELDGDGRYYKDQILGIYASKDKAKRIKDEYCPGLAIWTFELDMDVI